MSLRVGLLFALLLILAAVLWFIPMDGFMNLSPSDAPNMVQPSRLYPARHIASSGPMPPNQMAEPDEVRVMPREVASDPYATNEESASIPERLRNPERMFQPAPSNTTVDIAEASGIASASANQAANAMQAFAPEMAQNGGEFMNGIFANDSSEGGGFASF